jgi:hypothetical protein
MTVRTGPRLLAKPPEKSPAPHIMAELKPNMMANVSELMPRTTPTGRFVSRNHNPDGIKNEINYFYFK